MSSKSDELDYIVSVMKKKKDELDKQSQGKKIIRNNNNISKKRTFYKLSANKVHKNITLDEEIVIWVDKEAKEFHLNFSETINQILRFAKENSKKK